MACLHSALVKKTVLHALGVAALASLCLLASCARSGGPAPVELRGLATASAPPRAPGAVAQAPLGQAAPARGGAGGHVVTAGETLYGVARQYSLPVRAVIDANGLQPPYQLLIGQRLAIPQQRTHLVSTGDTLYSISRRYGVDMSEVVRLNKIAPPYAVKLGETLLLPSPVMTAAAAAPSAPSAAAAVTAAPLAAAPSSPAAAPLAAAAPLSSGVSVAVTPLAPIVAAPLATPLPGPPALAAAAPAAADGRPPTRPVVSTRRDAATEPQPSEALPPQESSLASAAIPPAAATAAPAPEGAEPATPLPEAPAIGPAPQQQAVLAPPAPPPRAARTFLWPVRGRVLATYGERGGGLHNDGINIAASKGTPVHAAENGVVAYAGNEIRGFGNLLLIKHADGFMTAYAHNDALLVQRGDVVRRGQVVARVGQTGNVAQPQLHFEVRKGTQAIDPESVLGNPASASAF